MFFFVSIVRSKCLCFEMKDHGSYGDNFTLKIIALNWAIITKNMSIISNRNVMKNNHINVYNRIWEHKENVLYLHLIFYFSPSSICFHFVDVVFFILHIATFSVISTSWPMKIIAIFWTHFFLLLSNIDWTENISKKKSNISNDNETCGWIVDSLNVTKTVSNILRKNKILKYNNNIIAICNVAQFYHQCEWFNRFAKLLDRIFRF